MCDAGRLNYKWIQREDRLKDVLVRGEKSSWTVALSEIADKLKQAPAGSVAIVASARQTNEELWLLSKLKAKLGAISDSVPRIGKGDNLLVDEDKNPNTNGARLTGMSFTEMGINLSKIAAGIARGEIKTLIVFGEDLLMNSVKSDKLRDKELTSEVISEHGITAEFLGKLDTLIVSDILPNATAKYAHYVLPGCAHAEKRGSFTNRDGRVQKFMQAIQPQGRRARRMGFPARPGLQRHRQERFPDHRRFVQRDGEGCPGVQRPHVGQPRRHGRDGEDLR
jgi:NADH-quinone oxidoreductase subunit G